MNALGGGNPQTYAQNVTRFVLLTAQIMVAAFYAWSAVLMWGPFMEAPIANKLLVAAIVLWPIFGLVAASRRIRLFSLGTTGVLALLTACHLIIVLIFVMTAQ